MATFNVAAAFGKKSSSSSYNFLVDQLDIKQSELEADGKLTPGDYELLVREAQKIYAYPGLSAEQRSNVEVKIASYKSQGKKNSLKDSNDINKLNREVDNEVSRATVEFGGDPYKFVQVQAAALNAKIDQLSASIDSLESAGDDTTNHYNELNAALLDYQDLLQASSDMENYDGASAPKTNYAAYVVTNSSGEIVDFKVSRVGTKTGYIATTGVYGGLPVYGKLSRKEGGKNIFVFGNQTFVESNELITGPEGTKNQTILVPEKSPSIRGGGVSINTKPTVIDPAQVRTQSSVRTGGYVEDENKFLYRKNEDGSFTKFVNWDKQKNGINDSEVMRMPRGFIQGITPYVSETKDGLDMPDLPVPNSGSQFQATSTPAAAPATSTPALEAGNPRTPSPTERAPKTGQNIAQRALGAAKSFLGGVFGNNY